MCFFSSGIGAGGAESGSCFSGMHCRGWRAAAWMTLPLLQLELAWREVQSCGAGEVLQLELCFALVLQTLLWQTCPRAVLLVWGCVPSPGCCCFVPAEEHGRCLSGLVRIRFFLVNSAILFSSNLWSFSPCSSVLCSMSTPILGEKGKTRP